MKRRVLLQAAYSDYLIDVQYDLGRVYLIINGKEYDYNRYISPKYPLTAKIGSDIIEVQFDRTRATVLFCGVRILVNDILVANN